MGEQTEPNPGPRRLREMAEALIESQSTMTLATAEDRRAWAAPVYYVFAGRTFYFFSTPDSRHIREAMAGSETAAAVFAASDSWREIRGLQMSGRVEGVSAGLEAIKGIQAYLRKYSFTQEFFKPGQRLDLHAFTERFRVKLYAFRPFLVLYLDNSIRFGFREEIHL